MGLAGAWNFACHAARSAARTSSTALFILGTEAALMVKESRKAWQRFVVVISCSMEPKIRPGANWWSAFWSIPHPRQTRHFTTTPELRQDCRGAVVNQRVTDFTTIWYPVGVVSILLGSRLKKWRTWRSRLSPARAANQPRSSCPSNSGGRSSRSGKLHICSRAKR